MEVGKGELSGVGKGNNSTTEVTFRGGFSGRENDEQAIREVAWEVRESYGLQQVGVGGCRE